MHRPQENVKFGRDYALQLRRAVKPPVASLQRYPGRRAERQHFAQQSALRHYAAAVPSPRKNPFQSPQLRASCSIAASSSTAPADDPHRRSRAGYVDMSASVL